MRITVIPVRFPVPPRERFWMPASSCSLALLKEYQRPFAEKCVNRKIFSPARESPHMKRNSHRPLAVESVQKRKSLRPLAEDFALQLCRRSPSWARSQLRGLLPLWLRGQWTVDSGHRIALIADRDPPGFGGPMHNSISISSSNWKFGQRFPSTKAFF